MLIPKHLQAALAWMNYAIATIKYVFADQAVSPQIRENRSHADKILAFLRRHPEGASLTELSGHCFKRNLSSEKIQKSLAYLLSENPSPIEQIDTEKREKGRPKIIYRTKTGTNLRINSGGHAVRGLEGIT